jgi:ribokinase
MTAKWDIVVVGGVNTDYLVRGAQLPGPGQTLDGHTFIQGLGGKGANQAVAAARLGARVAFVARVGADARGEEVLEQLRAEGVDVGSVFREPQQPTGAAVIMVNEAGQKQIFAAPGANRRLSPDDIGAAANVIAAANVVLAQLEVPVDTVAAAFQLARRGGAKTVLDPAPPRALPEDVLRLVDVVKPNAHEAEWLTGVVVRHQASAREAARQLLARGAAAVAIESGSEGNLLVWREGEVWLPRIPVASVDATGAGDAFAAALAVTLSEGRTLEEAGRFANAAAALATTAVGAQAGLPRRDALEALVARTYKSSDQGGS